MSDPRQFERDPNFVRNSYSDNRSGLRDTSIWIAIIVAILVVFGAISRYGGSGTGSDIGTTSGEATRPPVTTTPPLAPPAPQP
jgi:hypothetical protein